MGHLDAVTTMKQILVHGMECANQKAGATTVVLCRNLSIFVAESHKKLECAQRFPYEGELRILIMKHLFSFALLFTVLTSLAQAEPRTFTNTQGKTITANLVCATADFATLKLSTGKDVEVPVSSLSEADKKFVKDWIEENTLGGTTGKDMDTQPHQFLDLATGKLYPATLAAILEDEDLQHFVVLRYPNGTSRALRLKSLSSKDQEYVMSKWSKKGDEALAALEGNPDTKKAADAMRELMEAIKKAAKK